MAGPGLAALVLRHMAVDVSPASLMLWPTALIYIRGAGLGHAGLDILNGPFPWPGFDQSAFGTFPNAASCTQFRLVAPSAPPLSLFAFRPRPAACLLADCPA